MRYRYLHLDVFTSNRFEGNQLAVFPEPAGLSPEMMQQIAREMAFSESTFIFPPEKGGDVRMRIFTPGEELPLAGHPTVGSTFALAAEGVIARGRDRFVFELGVGPTPVALEWNESGLAFAWMTQPLPSFGPVVADRRAVAAALGVGEPDLSDTPAQVVSCGVPFLFVRLATRRAVDSAALDRKALRVALAPGGADELPVFFFTTEGAAGDVTVYSRMLAPGLGVAEDPATGGASGPLGCYLLHHRIVTHDQATQMLSHQGVAMGRPSRVHISIENDAGTITRVRVGGVSVMVGDGYVEV